MTRLQTRVDDRTARRFKKAARERGETTCSLLQKLVADTATAAEPDSWVGHWDKAKSLHLKPARKTLAQLRKENGER